MLLTLPVSEGWRDLDGLARRPHRRLTQVVASAFPEVLYSTISIGGPGIPSIHIFPVYYFTNSKATT